MRTNDAIYVALLGDERNGPLNRLGVCAIEDVPKDAELVVSSPNADEIFALIVKMKPLFNEQASVTELLFAAPVDDAIGCLLAACDVERLDKKPSKFKYEIVKSLRSPQKGKQEVFEHKMINAFNTYAHSVVSAVHAAVEKAVAENTNLESVFFEGLFDEMSGTPQFVYTVECRGSEDVVVGGEMVFEQKSPGSKLVISEKMISLIGAGGYNGASLSLNEELEKNMIDAIVAFFVRCHAKRM